MYTVLRLLPSGGAATFLDPVIRQLSVDELNAPRRRPDGFFVELHDGESWGDHLAAIRDYVVKHHEPLETATALGVEVEVDVAVEPEDVNQRLLLELGLPADVMSTLASAGVTLLVSLCALGES